MFLLVTVSDYIVTDILVSVKNVTVLRILRILAVAAIIFIGTYQTQLKPHDTLDNSTENLPPLTTSAASDALKALPIKGRAPKTGYTRAQFGDGWQNSGGCDTRNRILARDLMNVIYVPTTDVVVCKVLSGTLADPYTGASIQFTRGEDTSSAIQIDHVVALSDAWQKGAQALTPTQRIQLANDPLELLAVDGPANQAKSDGDAATWLPPNKAFRCDYVARQIAVKRKYNLWVTRSEYDTIARILNNCPSQQLPAS